MQQIHILKIDLMMMNENYRNLNDSHYVLIQIHPHTTHMNDYIAVLGFVRATNNIFSQFK